MASMDHQRHAHGLETTPGKLWPVLCCRGGHLVTKNMGEVNSAFFNKGTVHQHPAATAATLFANPTVLLPVTAIFCLQGLADAVLQSKKVVLNQIFVDLLHFILHG